MKQKITVECPECGRRADVYEGQDCFVCSDETGCAFVCQLDEIIGTISTDQSGRFVMTNTST